ncbi:MULTISPECIES: hypothetical protein [Bacteroides]|jgi:hypothetical protein|uniref:hypothetical protein n=1 Tax=Bacteroides TaxID=816 RepID=UPI000E4F8432|nr:MULTISPECIES: hypothetical protein [Bacteroides]RHL07543.1 hypothetical protein DW036_15090 [Bacteroides sp. AF39-11AC]
MIIYLWICILVAVLMLTKFVISKIAEYKYFKKIAVYSHVYAEEYSKIHKPRAVDIKYYFTAEGMPHEDIEYSRLDKYGDDFDYQLAKRIFSEKKEKCRCERLLYAEQIEKEYRKASEKYKYMQFRKYSYVYESFLYDIFSNEKYISKEHFGGIKKQIFCNLVKYLCKNNDKKAEELIQQWHEKELIYTDCEYVFLGETLTVYSNLLSSEDESISTWRKRNNIKMFI